MSNNAVEGIATVCAFWCSFAHDLFDLIYRVLRHNAGVDAQFCLAELVLALLAPHDGTIKQGIDIAERLAVAEL
jgi:hypothetical protein